MEIEHTAQLKGVAVVAMGTTLGVIDRALFDPATRALRAFQVRGEGRTFIVPWDLVEAVDADAVTVASGRVAQVAAQGGAFADLLDLKARACDLLDRMAAPLAAYGHLVDAAGGAIGPIGDSEPGSTTGRSRRGTRDRRGAIRGIDADIVTVAGRQPLTMVAAEPHAATP